MTALRSGWLGAVAGSRDDVCKRCDVHVCAQRQKDTAQLNDTRYCARDDDTRMRTSCGAEERMTARASGEGERHVGGVG